MLHHVPMARTNALRGAYAVQFAFVALLFFLFIMGLVELGRGMMVKHLLVNAARQGCRTGVIEGRSNTDITNAVVSTLNSQGISGDTATIQVNDNTANASTANAGDEITVIVSVPTDSVSWVPGARYLTGGTISGKYTLRRE